MRKQRRYHFYHWEHIDLEHNFFYQIAVLHQNTGAAVQRFLKIKPRHKSRRQPQHEWNLNSGPKIRRLGIQSLLKYDQYKAP